MGMGKLSRFSAAQSINTPAIRSFFQLFSDPTLVIPNKTIKHVSELQYDKLKADGIKYLVFDKDNTLTLAFSDTLHESVLDSIKEAKTIFPGCVAILSNSVGSCDDVDYKGAIETEENLGIPVIRHKHKKPNCFDEVRMHFSDIVSTTETQRNDEVCTSANEKVNDINTANDISTTNIRVLDDGTTASTIATTTTILPGEICVIGDRVLTDIMFANMYGMYSISVNPLSVSEDHPVARVARSFETSFLLPIIKGMGFKRGK